jgi:hypothetical protein
MPTAITKEEQRLIDSYLASQMTGGASYDDSILAENKEYFVQDGNIDAYMAYYFSQDFVTWEAVNAAYFEFLENNNQGQARLPATHGKTTMTLDWFAYVFCRCPDVSAIYTEKNLPTAQGRCYSLMGKLESNERLIYHYGEFKGDLWSTQAFTIRQRPRRIDTPSFRVYGAGGGSVLGQRCNIEVNDDPVTDENNASENERESLWRWYTKAAATAPYPLPVMNPRYKKKHFLVGTVFGLDDLYHRAAKAKADDPGYAYLHLQAVPDELTGATLSPRFCYIDPEDLTRKADEDAYYADLKRKVELGDVENLFSWRRSNGTWAFYQRYQNIAIDKARQKFPEVWFTGGTDEMAPPGGYPGCYDKFRSLGEPRRSDLIYATGVDPAAGKDTRASVRFACVTIGFEPNKPGGNVFLVDLDYGKYPLVSDTPGKQTQVDLVLDQAGRYGSRIILETNNIQGVYYDVLMKEARRRGMSIRVSGHHTSKEKKVDFQNGVEAMQPMVENGWLRLPFKEPHDKTKVGELVDELQFLGNFGTDDIAMALWFAWRLAERSQRVKKQAYKPRENPWYFNRQSELRFPRHWTQEQIDAYLHGGAAEDVEETEEVA